MLFACITFAAVAQRTYCPLQEFLPGLCFDTWFLPLPSGELLLLLLLLFYQPFDREGVHLFPNQPWDASLIWLTYAIAPFRSQDPKCVAVNGLYELF